MLLKTCNIRTLYFALQIDISFPLNLGAMKIYPYKCTACIGIWMTKDQALVLTIILHLKKRRKKRENRKTDPMGGCGSTS